MILIYLICIFHPVTCNVPNELVTPIRVRIAAGAMQTMISDIRKSIFCFSSLMVKKIEALAGCKI